MNFHLCGGQAHREFFVDGRYEYWVWCKTCGNWYLGMVISEWVAEHVCIATEQQPENS